MTTGGSSGETRAAFETAGTDGGERSPIDDGASNEIRFEDITKIYGGTRALDDVSLTISRGMIHAFVGENGAGKSTLLGVLAGRVAPTAGRVTVFGEELRCGDPRVAHAAGIVAIYQELTTVPSLSATANVFVGQNLSRKGLLQNGAMRARFLELSEEIGAKIDPDAKCRRLSVADRQLIEIMRALQAGAKVILFDEPTEPLSQNERDELFRLMRALKEDGRTMVFVSHNLDEVLGIADIITVFRDGHLERTRPASEWTKRDLIFAMLGKDLSAHIDTGEVSFMAEHRERSESEAVLSVRNVSLPGILDNVSFDVRPGEVLGIAGLVGSGRTELLRCLCGLERRSSGNLVVKGREVKWPRTVRAALKAGIAMIPEDRKFSGLIPCMSAADNITLSDLGGVARQGWISDRVLVRRARECAGAVHFDLNRIEGAARRLSGGNQQKLLVARWIHRPPLVLLADEPTRGVDVGAKETIAQSLRKLAVEQGMGLVLVSSVLEEVLAIADTVVVLSGGRMAARFDNRDRTVKEDEVLTAAFSAVSKCA